MALRLWVRLTLALRLWVRLTLALRNSKGGAGLRIPTAVQGDPSHVEEKERTELAQITSEMLAFLLLPCVSALVLPSAHIPARPRAPPPSAFLEPSALVDLPLFNLLAEIVDGDGERVYGAVDAPGYVAPLAGILAISTALLPVLLAPGDDAFRAQQDDEQKVANQFGRDRKRK